MGAISHLFLVCWPHEIEFKWRRLPDSEIHKAPDAAMAPKADKKRKRSSSASSIGSIGMYSAETLAEMEREEAFRADMASMSTKNLVEAISSQLKMAGLLLGTLSARVAAADEAAGRPSSRN